MRRPILAHQRGSASYVHMTLNHRLLPALVLLAGFLQIVTPYQGWMMLLIAFGSIWFVAWIWAQSIRQNLKLNREMRMGWVQVGDQLEERFTLVNKGLIPALWAEIVDNSTLPFHEASRVTGVDGDAENSWTIKTRCMHRGAFVLGPTSLRTADPFGIYTVVLDYPGTSSMMVMPPIVPLPGIEVAPGGRAGEGRRRIGAHERTTSATGVREYQSGDSRSRVHWRTTARRDQLFVRLFESTPSSDWWIIVDLDYSVQTGVERASTVEHGIILAASLADRGLRGRRAVGLVASGANVTWLPPRQGAGQRWEILRALAVAKEGKRPLGQVLAQIGPSLKGISSLIIITPAVCAEWIETLIPLIWRGVVPTILLLDAATFGSRVGANNAAATLVDLGIAHYLVPRDLLDRQELNRNNGQTEWRISPRGRAIMISTPRETAWKSMSDA